MRCWINSGILFHNMKREELRIRLKQFLDDEARSCSMDFGCITPLYVYLMWGGEVPLNDIEKAMSDVGRMM